MPYIMWILPYKYWLFYVNIRIEFLFTNSWTVQWQCVLLQRSIIHQFIFFSSFILTLCIKITHIVIHDIQSPLEIWHFHFVSISRALASISPHCLILNNLLSLYFTMVNHIHSHLPISLLFAYQWIHHIYIHLGENVIGVYAPHTYRSVYHWETLYIYLQFTNNNGFDVK